MPREYTRDFSIVTRIPDAGGILFFDDFEDGINGDNNGTGTDWLVQQYPAKKMTRTKSLRLRTKTTTPATDDYVVHSVRLYPPITQIIELGIFFNLPAFTGIDTFSISIYRNDGTNVLQCSIRYNTAAASWQYINSAGTWTTITGGAWAGYTGTWHKLTLRVNLNTDTYIKASINDTEFDLEDIAAYTDTSGLAKHLWISTYLKTSGAAQKEAFIDTMFLRESGG